MKKFLGTIGSLIVKRGADGRLQVAVAPLFALVAFSGTLGCLGQADEPYSTCVKSVLTTFVEGIGL